MTLHLNLPHHQSQAEVREARRQLKERIRTDWEFPPLPAWKSSGKTVAGFRLSGDGGEDVALGFDPVEWRERQYSSASEAEESSTPYKFDKPDSVGSQLQERKLAKKRKRHAALKEEMRWNDGLEHWIRRRDIWCCARKVTERRILEDSEEPAAAAAASSLSTTSVSASPSPRSSTSSTGALTSPPTSPTSLATSPDLVASSSPSPNPTLSLEVLVPIAPPILQNHPVRRKITTNTYPEIYSKIILQSRTPSVPINLQILVNALVQGWKDDGEWPPKSGPLEKSIGRKKGGGIRDGVKRVLRLTGVSEHS